MKSAECLRVEAGETPTAINVSAPASTMAIRLVRKRTIARVASSNSPVIASTPAEARGGSKATATATPGMALDSFRVIV